MTQHPPIDAPDDWTAIQSVLNHAGQRGDTECIAVIDRLYDDRRTLTAEVTRLREQLAQARAAALAEAGDHLDRIAADVERRIADVFGPASGIGPGSADMVREAATTVRALATTQPAARTAT
jgi:hypothetical protein